MPFFLTCLGSPNLPRILTVSIQEQDGEGKPRLQTSCLSSESAWNCLMVVSQDSSKLPASLVRPAPQENEQREERKLAQLLAVRVSLLFI